MNLNVEVAEADTKTIIQLSGEIDAYTAPKLKETLLSNTTIKGQTVEVDMGNVNYMDSTGLGVFVSALKSTNENESHLQLVNLQDRVFRLFKITGLEEIIDINSTVKGGSE